MANITILLGAILSGVAVIVAAIITARAGNRKQLNEIHVLVNSRLTAALSKIDELTALLVEHDIDAGEPLAR